MRLAVFDHIPHLRTNFLWTNKFMEILSSNENITPKQIFFLKTLKLRTYELIIRCRHET